MNSLNLRRRDAMAVERAKKESCVHGRCGVHAPEKAVAAEYGRGCVFERRPLIAQLSGLVLVDCVCVFVCVRVCNNFIAQGEYDEYRFCRIVFVY